MVIGMRYAYDINRAGAGTLQRRFDVPGVEGLVVRGQEGSVAVVDEGGGEVEVG